MKTLAEITEYAREWLKMVEPFRSPDLGLVWVRQTHTAGRGAPEGLERYHPVAQDGLYYITALLLLDEKVEEACRGIDSTLGCQVTDPASEQYGSYRWYIEDPKVADSNGTFFVNLSLLIIYLKYADKLGEDRLARMRESFRHSLNHFMKRVPNVKHTNGFLGDGGMSAIMAEMFGDTAALTTIRGNWEKFYQTNFEGGINERLSPGYYGVDLTALALTVATVRDPRIRRIARETFDMLLQETFFFEQRTPLPARRTYNACGEALNFGFHAWSLGINPMSVSELARRGFLHGAVFHNWLALSAAGISPDLSNRQPAPRILEGRFADEDASYSYFHPDFTLGSFTRHPEPGGLVTSPYEMNAGFSGDGDNLGLAGLAFQMADGNWTGLPARDELRDAGPTWRTMSLSTPIAFNSIAHQHENVMVWFSDIDGFHASVRSLGATLRVPQFTGQAYNENGQLLTGEGGSLEDGWIFLITARARFGIRPLQRSSPDLSHPQTGRAVWYCLPADPDTFRSFPGPWHVHPDRESINPLADATSRRFGIYLPSFEENEAREVKCDNVASGLVLVAGGHKTTPEEFMKSCRALQIEETWRTDGATSRENRCEDIRSVSVSGPDSSLRLVYDYKLNRTLERSVNDLPRTKPDARPGVRWVS